MHQDPFTWLSNLATSKASLIFLKPNIIPFFYVKSNTCNFMRFTHAILHSSPKTQILQKQSASKINSCYKASLLTFLEVQATCNWNTSRVFESLKCNMHVPFENTLRQVLYFKWFIRKYHLGVKTWSYTTHISSSHSRLSVLPLRFKKIACQRHSRFIASSIVQMCNYY